MADINAIVLPDGTSYNIKDTTYSAGTGISLSGTTINHSNSITEQTTQAIYPIAIDAQGHITSYGDAVTVSDTKVTQTYALAANFQYWRPLVIGSSSFSSETGTPSTVTNNTYTFKTLLVQPSSGTIRINNLALANGNYKTTFSPTTLTDNRTITIPDNTGTLALTSDIPSAATAAPIMDGTAAVGSSAKYALEDHVHPKDTTKADVSTTVTNVGWDSTNKKIQKTINGTTSDVVVIPIIAGTGTNSAVGGYASNIASGDYSFAFGINAQATNFAAIALNGIASGVNSIVLSSRKIQNFNETEASGEGAIAIGQSTWASGLYSISIGQRNTASGTLSYAIGIKNIASGIQSVAIGNFCEATALVSTAIGVATKASSQFQTAMGIYNIEDDQSTYLFILGNGTDDNNRSNAMTVDWNGNISANNILASASINSTGLISFKNSNNTAVFTLQLPLYNGGVS